MKYDAMYLSTVPEFCTWTIFRVLSKSGARKLVLFRMSESWARFGWR